MIMLKIEKCNMIIEKKSTEFYKYSVYRKDYIVNINAVMCSIQYSIFQFILFKNVYSLVIS